jgi:hypothetical protein
MAQAAVSELRVEVGAYTVSFTKQVQAATALAFHALVRGENDLSKELLQLNCNVVLRADVALVDAGFGGHTYIHAFAEGRGIAIRQTRAANPPHFLLSHKGKRTKAADAVRHSFLQLFPSVPQSGKEAWGDFSEWVEGTSTSRAVGAVMTDAWLLLHICDLEWLGNMWRSTGDGLLSLVSGHFHIHIGRALFTKPSMNIAIAGSSAASFLPPSWPKDTVEVLTLALLQAVGPAHQLLVNAGVPPEFYSVDPLALDYPPVFDTRKIA